jgi:hypothetical protein
MIYENLIYLSPYHANNTVQDEKCVGMAHAWRMDGTCMAHGWNQTLTTVKSITSYHNSRQLVESVLFIRYFLHMILDINFSVI